MTGPVFAATVRVGADDWPAVVRAPDPAAAQHAMAVRLGEHGLPADAGRVDPHAAPDPALATALTGRTRIAFGAGILRLPPRDRRPPRPVLPAHLDGGWIAAGTLSARAPDDAVPDGLQPLFAGPETVYALLDAARAPGLPETLEAAGADAVCLFRGKAADDLGDVAPWLVRVKADAFRRNLFVADPDVDAPWHLGSREPGLLIRSEAPMAEVAARLRRLTRIRMAPEDGRWVMFRFWDPRTVETLAPHLTPEDAEALLGPDTVVGLSDGPRLGLALRAPPHPGANRPPARFAMRAAYLDAMADAETARFRRRLVADARALSPGLSQDEAGRLVDLGLDVCASVGLRQRDTIAGYVMLTAGMGWDVAHRYAVAAPILEPARPEAARKTLIHALLGRVPS